VNNVLLPLIGLLLGIIIGLVYPIYIPVNYAPYVSIAVLAALDSVFGGLKAVGENNFDVYVFITGFFTNALLAGFLAYIGDRLGIPIYLAAIFVFGVRIFQNLAIIRRDFLNKFLKNQK